MSELHYLDTLTEYRTRLLAEVSAGVAEINRCYRSRRYDHNNYIPEFIFTQIQLKKMTTLSDFEEKDRGTWELKPFTSTYGAWFDHAPLEIVPPLPDAPPSAAIAELLEYFSEWGIAGDRLDHQAIFRNLFDEEVYRQCSRSDRLHRQWLGLYLLSADRNPWERDVLYNASHGVHSDAHVRGLVLSLAFFDLPWVPAERYVYDCTHDTDEVVFIKAFRICGRIHDERAMDHLRPIVQSPSAVLKGLMSNKMYYPVGHAACNICPAQFAIIGTDDPTIAGHREAELMKRIRRPLSEPVEHRREEILMSIRSSPLPGVREGRPTDLDAMIRIPKGTFLFGMMPEDIQDEVFDWSTCTPQREIELDEFYIDKYPVTNREYDLWEEEFSRLPEDEKALYEHFGQKKGKSHRRNTFDDPRFGEDHPVVGIDWFDAWCYARYHNKELPTEYQWEKAARGETSWRYPWGDRFDRTALRYAGETYGVIPANILEWIILLNKGTKSFPQSTTSPVYAHPGGSSPYGVQDMCGNCWEYTTTSFVTGEEARVPFADFTPIELMGTREGHVVIRGGAWSSPAPLIGSSYRGYDLLTDRHTEIGFRCVFNPG